MSPIGELETWWTGHVALPADDAITRAALGGFAADRLGYAFASGYQAALQRLTGGAPTIRRSLLATELGGAHPRKIQTALREDAARPGGWRLRGEKRFATLGASADELLVVARAPAPEQELDRPRLVVVVIPSDRAGVRFEPLPPTPFTPELPHARARLDDVEVAPKERLPGDGYASYLKPFRTIEDCFVHVAALAWWIRLARAPAVAAPESLVERLLAALLAVATIAGMDPRAPAVHLALAGELARARALLAELEPLLRRLGPEARARWERDRALLEIAGNARARRREAAWRRIAAHPGERG